MNLRKDKPVTYLGMTSSGNGIGKSSHATTLPMSDEDKAEAKLREANKPPFGFAPWE